MPRQQRNCYVSDFSASISCTGATKPPVETAGHDASSHCGQKAYALRRRRDARRSPSRGQMSGTGNITRVTNFMSMSMRCVCTGVPLPRASLPIPLSTRSEFPGTEAVPQDTRERDRNNTPFLEKSACCPASARARVSPSTAGCELSRMRTPARQTRFAVSGPALS